MSKGKRTKSKTESEEHAKSSRRRSALPGPNRKYVRFEGHDHNDIVYSVPQDWSRYIERVEKLIDLNEDHRWIHAIFQAALLPWWSIPGTRLAAWVDQGYEPPDDTLRDMVHHLRQFVTEKAQRNGQPYTGTDLLNEFGVKVYPITVKYNWTPYLKTERDEWRESYPNREPKECRENDVLCTKEAALPSGLPAVVTFVVPITQMKQWGLDKTMEDIKHVLQHALLNAPTREEAPLMDNSFPPQRAFLLHCQEGTLDQDLKRYTRFAKEMLSIRQIAYLEHQERKGKMLSANEIPKKIKQKISGESGVSESIKRIFEGIYLCPFDGVRQSRITAPPQETETYNCGMHGQDCPSSCPNIKEWAKKYESSLPSPHHGQLRGETHTDDLDQLQIHQDE